nr:hypothetical protein B0A51_05539 [Rachicladosporium sp. CCFEE 5018]
MPFRPEHSLLRVEVPALHTIDTSSVETLFGMWSLFSKTAHAMEDGKRLENMSWRLWNRETFCCDPKSRARTQPRIPYATPPNAASDDIPVPALSSSLESAASDDFDVASRSATSLPQARPELSRHLSSESRSRGVEKHITPIDLENMVISIKETQSLEPIDLPMPTSLKSFEVTPPPQPAPAAQNASSEDVDTPLKSTSRAALESSSSTFATEDSQDSRTRADFEESSCTEVSTHSIIRGFTPGGAPSSYRSQTNLAALPTPILKTSSQYQPPQARRKAPMFQIGTSSGEEESSLDSHMHSYKGSSLSASLRLREARKQTSFKEEVTVALPAPTHSPVFESEDEDDDASESAIEDDDDSSDWEDSDEPHSGPSSVNDTQLFQRVDSRPNLTSRTSMLTTMMHEPDRAKALANAASRSTSGFRRSRLTSPNGPSVATTPESGSQLSRAVNGTTSPLPIIMTTSNTHQQLSLSPRTTRRNMLSTELTESLRKNLLWERQHKSNGNLKAMKRNYTSGDVKNLRQQPEPGPVLSHREGGIGVNNTFFDIGLQEYHAKGW